MRKQEAEKLLEDLCWSVLEDKIIDEKLVILAVPDYGFEDDYDEEYDIRQDYDLDLVGANSRKSFNKKSHENLNIKRLQTSHIHGWNDTDVGICFLIEGGECCDILQVERFEVHFCMEAGSGREETTLNCATKKMYRAKFLWNSENIPDDERLKKAMLMVDMADLKNKAKVLLQSLDLNQNG
jgi:hypothetical protein